MILKFIEEWENMKKLRDSRELSYEKLLEKNLVSEDLKWLKEIISLFLSNYFTSIENIK